MGHIKAIEAGSGKNTWVNRFQELLEEEGEVDHVEFEEFLAIIEDLQGAGWSIKRVRENEKISDLDLRHIFEKVDVNQDQYVNRMEMRMACRYLCKQFNFNYKRTQELQKYLLEFDVDNDGMLDFEEFKLAIKFAQSKMKKKDKNEEGEF